MLSQRTGRAKLDDVTRILSELKTDLDVKKLSVEQRRQLLEQLKVYGRSVDNSDPIFTEDGLRTLGHHAFDGETTPAAQEALRCIANALLLQPKTRQILVNLGHGPHAAEKLKEESIDTEFLAARILFLTTYNANLDYAQLVRENQLVDSINAAITRHAKRYSKSAPRRNEQPMEAMALSETLKLLFNIIHHKQDLAPLFAPSIPNVFKILVRRGIPSPPLSGPTRELVNILLHLDIENEQGREGLFPSFDGEVNIRHLIKILDQALIVYPPKELDETVTPLLTLIHRIYTVAPAEIASTMEKLLLPTTEERDRPLGKSDTLSSRLLNLSTSALTPSLRNGISMLLWKLSHEDPATFVHNVGYGFASGFLMSNNIQMPEELVKEHAPESGDEGIPINPITGQRLDKEEQVQMEPMTQEEKEREAERLFVLFERLKATGVMDVVNPVEEAYRSGRIQELSDDED
ncbi:hypothetical protein AA0119_g5605 [Alternaria tenuissima]|uniref:Guanine nucleotide exchange factor n=2 Tax=Alternaria alternata complex TaxID=187734 RepID=A0A4Q4NI61_ALTAL|nr:uncharacterized protein J4E82_006873 [Alternaria postmessia]KAH6864502.1 guanine nucleotide exchange factor [Alternaria alternata]RYN25015.1 hypothetical protein AA0115_g7739 [Alternaria tenuissima]KAI5374458.1 hypothetical protein J4E82_006873 [Alternaria postmessia]OWY46661.1 guanine nucleotide exchange factor [Alternaria alternata]RYN76969.1 hypothetical protein AA0117_g5279 [Alternaria alternata]